MKRVALLLLVAGCSPSPEETPVTAGPAPLWSFDSTMVFPADGSLLRPEDGVALPDGRLIVGDQAHGLRIVETDGTSQPFGHLLASGYTHRPPARSGGANGVSLEPGGAHLLVSDVFGGGLYRVEVSSGATEKLYQHGYGINAAVRDSTGAIWFTQSTGNSAEQGEQLLVSAIDIPRPDGALFRLPFVEGRLGTAPQLMADSLLFANGVAIDATSGHLYLAETMAGRVSRFRVDLAAGTLSERSVFVDSIGADNLELDGAGNLWIVDPGASLVLMVNTGTGARQTAFHSQTAAQQETVAEFVRRGVEGKSRMELMTPALWAPLPAPITGVIVGPTGPVYLTGLGNALLKLPR